METFVLRVLSGGMMDLNAVIHVITATTTRNKYCELKRLTMVCIRRGYGGCVCKDCQYWLNKWERESKGWIVVKAMIQDKQSLYEIYERLQSSWPEMIQHH